MLINKNDDTREPSLINIRNILIILQQDVYDLHLTIAAVFEPVIKRPKLTHDNIFYSVENRLLKSFGRLIRSNVYRVVRLRRFDQ